MIKKSIIATIIILLFPFNCFAMKVGVVSDIHAGFKGIRKSGTSVVYPRKGVDYFEKAVVEMKKNGVELVVSLGDNTHFGEKKYYKKLKNVEKKYGITVLWIKGNHDDKDFRILGRENYIYEKDGIKFEIRNNSHCFKDRNCVMKKTDADVLLQHVPPFYNDTCDWMPNYNSEIESAIWSGHWHDERVCGDVIIFPALTEHGKLNYRIIEL
jgi:predicted phosphodiesterase